MSPLIRKLENHLPLSEPERRALLKAAQAVRRVPAREDLASQGEKPRGVSLMLSGFAQRYKTLEDGRRQMLALLVPGDICGLHNHILDEMDHSMATVTDAEVAVLTQKDLEALVESSPNMRRGLWWCQLVDEAICREWLVNVGQRSAVERTAHFFCELFWRLRAVGLTRGDACEMPFTQIELADTLGLTAVHVNRMVQELRREGLISLRDRELTIADLKSLEDVALFDPTYLHLKRRDSCHPEMSVHNRTRA